MVEEIRHSITISKSDIEIVQKCSFALSLRYSSVLYFLSHFMPTIMIHMIVTIQEGYYWQMSFTRQLYCLCFLTSL